MPVTPARRLAALVSCFVLVPLLAVTLGSAPSAGAPSGSLFSPLPGFRPGTAVGDVRPTAYRAYRADLDALRTTLGAGGAVRLTVPDPAGTPTTFTVAEDPVMASELQAAHPELRTYVGSTADGSTIRLDLGPLGFHAMVRRPDGVAWYVDPASRRAGEDRVLSYAGSAAEAPGETFVEKQVRQAAEEVAPTDGFSTPGGTVSQRTFRLAFLTDPSYAAYVAPGATTHAAADPLVLAAKVALINRVNQVYNDDVAYRFELVAGTDTRLNLLNAAEMTGTNGPCGASACYTPDQASGCDGPTLDRNAFVLGQLVGADTFDIGHIGFGLNGGGLAGLGVVGGADKAAGCTGVPTPVGDVYAVDYVAHELGHQMGGNHTFNGTQTNCSGGNRNAGTSVEPGSGVTVMAYAGICSSDNLQPHSDPYFSFRSIEEFEATTAETRSSLAEVQQVQFTGLDAGEQLTLSCATGCTSSTVTFSGNPVTDAASLTTAVSSVTGTPAVVTGYDGAALPTAAGFTARWTATTDRPRLTVAPAGGAVFTASVGVTTNGGPETNGGTVTVTGNRSPVVTAPADKTVPKQTPFTLTGAATDADAGDTLTYLWEQTDAGSLSGTGLTSNTKTNGPLFRVFGTYAAVTEAGTITYNSPGENLAGTDPSRTFPDLAQVVAGNTNAKTGTCPAPAAGGTIPVSDPALNCFSEFLPTSAWLGSGNRVVHFRLTARDEFTPDAAADHPGGVSWDDVALTVDPSAGPFLVTSRATSGTASGAETVTWDVAGTNTAAMATAVRISLSTDGGVTFPTVLAASTPNDGSQAVVLPSVTTSQARIKVEAVGNYFFDMNDASFSIAPATDQAPTVDAGPDASVAAGTPFTRTGNVADEDLGTVTATVDYGDGTGTQPLTMSGGSFTLNHTFSTAGTRTVTVTAKDAGGKTGSDTVTVTVTQGTTPPPPPPSGPVASTVTASAQPAKVLPRRKFAVLVTVAASGQVPTGAVEVRKGQKVLATGTLTNGTVTVKVSKKQASKLRRGKNTLTVAYLGSAAVSPSQVDVVVKVKRKRR